MTISPALESVESAEFAPPDAKQLGETTAQLRALAEAFPTPRHAVAHIMAGFPIVQRREA